SWKPLLTVIVLLHIIVPAGAGRGKSVGDPFIAAAPRAAGSENAMRSEPAGQLATVRHAGPNPGAVPVVSTALFTAGLIPVPLIVSETHSPSPLQSPEEMVSYFRGESARVRVCAFLQFAAAVPLGIYSATMASRLRFHRVEAAGVSIALFGGQAASA